MIHFKSGYLDDLNYLNSYKDKSRTLRFLPIFCLFHKFKDFTAQSRIKYFTSPINSFLMVNSATPSAIQPCFRLKLLFFYLEPDVSLFSHFYKLVQLSNSKENTGLYVLFRKKHLL